MELYTGIELRRRAPINHKKYEVLRSTVVERSGDKEVCDFELRSTALKPQQTHRESAANSRVHRDALRVRVLHTTAAQSICEENMDVQSTRTGRVDCCCSVILMFALAFDIFIFLVLTPAT